MGGPEVTPVRSLGRILKALWLFSVWLHVLAAATWVGGMIFFVSVLLPTIKRSGRITELIAEVGNRFRRVGWVALGVLVLTGVTNLWLRGVLAPDRLLDAAFWWGPWGRALALKLLVVGGVLSLSAAHDFGIGRTALKAWERDPGAPETRRLRRLAAWLGRLNLLLGLLAVLLGVILVRGWPG